jgi:hypothetical protein
MATAQGAPIYVSLEVLHEVEDVTEALRKMLTTPDLPSLILGRWGNEMRRFCSGQKGKEGFLPGSGGFWPRGSEVFR